MHVKLEQARKKLKLTASSLQLDQYVLQTSSSLSIAESRTQPQVTQHGLITPCSNPAARSNVIGKILSTELHYPKPFVGVSLQIEPQSHTVTVPSPPLMLLLLNLLLILLRPNYSD